MEKLESSFKNMVISLGVIALVSAFLLSFVYSLTEEPIKNARNAKHQNALREVLPAFDRLDKPVEVNGLNVFRAYKNNKFVGAAVESFDERAFNGAIRVMVGFDAQGNVYNYVVLEQRETPGLGTEMVDWFKTDEANQNIIGRNPSAKSFRLTNDGGEIDGITASTISSRAFIRAIVKAYNAFYGHSEDPNALTGATGAVEATTGATGLDNKTGATSVDNTTGATQQKETPKFPKGDFEPLPPQKSPKEDLGIVPQLDSTSGATTNATEQNEVDSIVNNIQKEIEKVIDGSSGATKADKETEENL